MAEVRNPQRLRHRIPTHVRAVRGGARCAFARAKGSRNVHGGVRDRVALNHPRDGEDREVRQRRRGYGDGGDEGSLDRRVVQGRWGSGILASHGMRVEFSLSFSLILENFEMGFWNSRLSCIGAGVKSYFFHINLLGFV